MHPRRLLNRGIVPRPFAERGAGVVYTQEWVVDLMLDLAGYDPALDLGEATLIEPGCGDGAFLRKIVPRLLQSARNFGRSVESLAQAIRGYELDPAVADMARRNVISALIELSVSRCDAEMLAATWVVTGDFLLEDHNVAARWIVGNPPYVRVEEANSEVYSKYRARWATMSGRADIYVGFFEAALGLLEPGGRLCFICADRWMHNQYGASLRRHVVDKFAMRLLLELHGSDVFDVPVAAYPAITVMDNAPHSSTVLATATPAFSAVGAHRLFNWWTDDLCEDVREAEFSASLVVGRFRADTSWPSGPPERLRLIADMEARLPTLTEVGVRIGVGIATGADKVYVVTETGGVEAEFLKPAVGPADLRGGAVQWSGRRIVSPWRDGKLLNLADAPGLARYFRRHAKTLKARYVGKRNPNAWWRTIDRPPADEYKEPKLIVADINDRIEPVLDMDGYWPLHSAYFITSTKWDLEALGGYLLSDIAGMFVEAYSVKMANGHLRVSAQYLKKIRLPEWADVDRSSRLALAKAFRDRDRDQASVIARRLSLCVSP